MRSITYMTDFELSVTAQKLLDQPYMVIDILPVQVPADSAGQFAKVEQFMLKDEQPGRIHRSFAEIIMKLNCYFDIAAAFCTRSDEWSSWKFNPDPDQLISLFTDENRIGSILIMIPDEKVLISADRQDVYMTVFNAAGAVLEIIQALTSSEGLFLRKPEQ